MVGNLVAKVATGCRAEPGDMYAATRMHGPTVGWRQDLHRTRVLRHLPAKLSAPEIAEAIAVLAWIKFRPRRSHR